MYSCAVEGPCTERDRTFGKQKFSTFEARSFDSGEYASAQEVSREDGARPRSGSKLCPIGAAIPQESIQPIPQYSMDWPPHPASIHALQA